MGPCALLLTNDTALIVWYLGVYSILFKQIFRSLGRQMYIHSYCLSVCLLSRVHVAYELQARMCAHIHAHICTCKCVCVHVCKRERKRGRGDERREREREILVRFISLTIVLFPPGWHVVYTVLDMNLLRT